MNIIKKILVNSTPSSPTDMNELVTLPSLQLYLKRSPSSPKGELECICNDCVASIRKTSIPFNYQLIIQKLYQEDELDNEDDFEEEDDAKFDSQLKDEWEFLIDESLSFQMEKDGAYNISWREVNGDFGDRFQLVVDPKFVKPKAMELFINTIYRCIYERKYNLDSDEIADEQIVAEFGGDNGKAEANLYKQFDKTLNLKDSEADDEKSDDEDDEDDEDDFHDAEEGSVSLPGGDVVFKQTVQYYYFNPKDLKFLIRDKKATVTLVSHGNFAYSLMVTSSAKTVRLPVSQTLNSAFDYDSNSFVFNNTSEGKSYLVKFEDSSLLSNFQEQFQIALWETLNKKSWIDMTAPDRSYVLSDNDDLVLEGSLDKSESEDSDSDSSEDEEVPAKNLRFGKKDKLFVSDEDSDEDEAVVLKKSFVKSSKDGNNQLAVGYRNNRVFVSRGNNIGVFKEDSEDEDLKFHVAIKGLKAPGTKRNFNPSKMMLHLEDRSLIMNDANDPEHLYRMDIERGQIVDDYHVKQGLNVVDFNPRTKLSQLTDEQLFVGASNQGVFKIDPRLSGDKLVEKEYKNYLSKVGFTALLTTEAGNVAVLSKKGGIRLYDRLGINAKTQYPDLGEGDVGIDTTKDGKWILQTFKTYLLLINNTIPEGSRNAGFTGFQKSFDKDRKGKTTRLTLNPEHILYLSLSKTPLSFSLAKFNVDPSNDEVAIVTSSGPYVITWSLKKLIRNDKSYMIKRYGSTVVADNFKFGDDNKVFLLLQDDVTVVHKKSLKKPTRKSIGFNSIVKDYYD